VIRLSKSALLSIGLFALSTIFFTTGCGSSGSTQVRLLNAMSGQSSLNLLVDSKTLANGVGYGTASGYASASSGSRHVQIETSGTALIDQTISLPSGNDTILATNSGASVFTDNKTAPSSGSIQIRVINASYQLGTTDVYIVAPGTDISTVSPTVSGLSYQSASGYQTLSAGSYEVIFTQVGQKVAAIDSNSLSFSSGQIRTVVGLDGSNGGYTTAVLSDLN
jgi:hypothetical protein